MRVFSGSQLICVYVRGTRLMRVPFILPIYHLKGDS